MAWTDEAVKKAIRGLGYTPKIEVDKTRESYLKTLDRLCNAYINDELTDEQYKMIPEELAWELAWHDDRRRIASLRRHHQSERLPWIKT